MLGLLLFGREEALKRFLPTHEVSFQVLDGTDLRANAFFRWPLLRAMEEIVKRFEARNNEEELNVGPLRISIPDYSPRAFREAVANALVHRDYTRLGAVHVQWHADRLEVSNPGGFPEGVGLNNFLVAPPRPRNPLLADAFKRAGLVERTGRGIDTIFYEQLRHGRPSPHYDRTTANDVVLVVPGGRANLNFVRLIVKENDRRGKSLSLDELLVMNTLWLQRRLGVDEAARLTQKSVTEARSALERLTESGLVEGRGERRGRVYHLARSIYERFGDAEGHARQRGLAPEEAERKLIEHAMAGERVTRSLTAELLGLSPSQATRLLARLVAEGQLERKGRGKGTWYEPVG